MLANLAKMANLAKVAIWRSFVKAADKMLRANILTKARRALKKLANLAKMANVAMVAILAKFGQGSGGNVVGGYIC